MLFLSDLPYRYRGNWVYLSAWYHYGTGTEAATSGARSIRVLSSTQRSWKCYFASGRLIAKDSSSHGSGVFAYLTTGVVTSKYAIITPPSIGELKKFLRAVVKIVVHWWGADWTIHEMKPPLARDIQLFTRLSVKKPPVRKWNTAIHQSLRSIHLSPRNCAVRPYLLADVGEGETLFVRPSYEKTYTLRYHGMPDYWMACSARRPDRTIWQNLWS
jgi:hypothetical protein